MKLSEVEKNVKKKQKTAVVLMALIVFGGAMSFTACASHQTKKQVDQAQVLVDKQANELSNLQKEVTNLYSKEKPDFLNDSVSEETVYSIKDKLNKIQKEYKEIKQPNKKVKTEKYADQLESLKKSVEKVEAMVETQKQVNGLFEKEVITGDVLANDVPVNGKLEPEEFVSVKSNHYQVNANNDWQKAIDSLLDDAENQLKQIYTAKVAIEKTFKDNKVVSSDQKLYDSAKAEVDKIKSETVKKALLEQLDKVKADIDKKIKEEVDKAKNEQEDKVAEQQKATEQVKEQQIAIEVQQQGQATTDQGQSNGYTDNGGGYVAPAGGGNTGGASSGGSGSTGGGGQPTTPPTSGGGNSGGNGSVAPPPVEATRFQGWWYDGSQFHMAGIFDTREEALDDGKRLYKANGSIGSWGCSEI